MATNSQPYLINLSPGLARRVRELLERADSPYRDISELAAVAIENQLQLHSMGSPPIPTRATSDEAGWQPPERARGQTGTKEDPLLQLPIDVQRVERRPAQGTGSALFVLTNRLNPIPVALRVLVALSRSGSAPSIESFLDQASKRGRAIGLRLKQEDREVGRKGVDRRWIGWPVGDDEKKTIARFQRSFLLAVSGETVVGPLVDLGLAACDHGRVYSTDAGVQLAIAPNPLLREADDQLLSQEQRQVLRAAVLTNKGEVAELASYLRELKTMPLPIRRIDNAFESLHPSWSENQLTAHKAAVLGRLRDLGVLNIEAEGFNYRVVMLPEAQHFVEELLNAFQHTHGIPVWLAESKRAIS